MKNSNRWNRLAQAFVPNSPLVFTLPLGGKILKGWVRITGSLVLSGVTAQGTQKGVAGPQRLLSRIIVRVNPSSTSGSTRYPGGKIVDCDPESLLQYAIFQRGYYLNDQAAQNFAAGVAGTYPIELAIPIYWADANLHRQVQTALNADPSAYGSIQVEVDTADITNVFTGWTGTANYSGLQVQWIDDRENFAGDTFVRYQESHDFQIPAANDRALDQAMPQDGAFETFLIQGLQGAQEALADTIFQQLTLNGDAIDFQKYAPDIRQQMIDDEWINVKSSPATGLYLVDFTDGLVGGTINAATLQMYFKVANPSGANLDKLRFFTRRLMAPVGYAAAGGASSARNSS